MNRVLMVGHDGSRIGRALVAALVAAGLASCAGQTVRTEPVAAHCDALCYVPCTTDNIRWTADPNGAQAWDRLGDEVVQPLAQRVAECSQTKRACHTCLWRLQEQGVLVGIPPLPEEQPP